MNYRLCYASSRPYLKYFNLTLKSELVLSVSLYSI
jgi:hypothetical protein